MKTNEIRENCKNIEIESKITKIQRKRKKNTAKIILNK